MDSFVFAEDSIFSQNSQSACAVFGDQDVLALSHCDVRTSTRVMRCDYDDKTANIQRLWTHNCVADEALSEELQSSPMLLDLLGHLGSSSANASSSSATSSSSSAAASVARSIVGKKRQLEKSDSEDERDNNDDDGE